MLQSSNRGTPVSSDITKIVRQHYRPPSAKPYQHEQVQCRTETACKKEKPEDYWHVNYRRRQRNMDKGFYSTPWEPYRPIGGELVLDPYELVTSSLPGNMDRMVHPRLTRRGTIYEVDKADRASKLKQLFDMGLLLMERISPRVELTPTEKGRQSIRVASPDQEDISVLDEELIDLCPTAGFDNIKKCLRESSNRMTAVKAGRSYEEHVRQIEERAREEEELLNRSDPDDMVIQSTSIILPLIQSPKFELDEEDEERMRGGSPQSILTGSSVTSGSSGRKRSPFERRKSRASDGSRRSSESSRRRRSSIRPPQTKVSVIQVSSGITTSLLRQQRLCRDHLDYLTAIFNILTALSNMKVKDIRSKVPLSREVVEKLQKEGGRESQNEGGERPSSRATQMLRVPTRRDKVSSLDLDLCNERAESSRLLCKPSVASDTSKKSRWSRKMMSTDTVDLEPETDRGGRMSVFSTVKRMTAMENVGKFFGRRRSRNVAETLPQRPALETWEDLLNVQPQEYKEEPQASFGLQVGIVTKFMRWYRRASVTPTHGGANVLPTIDRDQLRHLENIKEKGLEEKRESYGQAQPGSAAATQEKSRKLPLWQQVAQEKSTLFMNKKTTAPNPYSLIQRFHRDMNKMKQSVHRENNAELEKLAREKVASFRLKFSALSSEVCSSLFAEQQYQIQQAKEKANRSHFESFDVQPSKWYEELREKTQTSPFLGDQAISDMLTKLQVFAHMDNKTVPYAKAKLCLLMMSLPAYDICQIQMQRALKFIFEQILLGSEAQFDEWLNHRKIPYVVLDPNASHRPSMGSPF